MTAQKLKNSILQMAVQGKLVPQDPNDEPASVLLERIRKEKEKLIKEGKIKRNKNESYIFRGADNLHYEQIGKEIKCIEDELPFEIPNNWCWSRLNYITSELGDGIHGTPEYDLEGSFYFINGNNLNNGEIIIKNDTKKVGTSQAKMYRKELNATSILVSINGTIGNVAFYNNEKIILGKSACYFNLLGNLSKHYFKALIESEYFKKYTKNIATGSTIKNVSLKAMRCFLVPLPPVFEQIRIVEKILELEPLVEKYKQYEERLFELNSSIKEQIKKSILQYAIEGKLVPQDPNDEPASILLERVRKEKEKLIAEGKIKKDKNESMIYRRDNSYYEKLGNREKCINEEVDADLPNSWIYLRLGEACNIINGFTPLRTKREYWSNPTIPWFTVDDIHLQGRKIYKTKQSINACALGNNSNRILPKETVLLCCTASVGE